MTVADWKRPERMPEDQWNHFVAAVRGEMKLLLGDITAEIHTTDTGIRVDLIREDRPVVVVGAPIDDPTNFSVWITRPRR